MPWKSASFCHRLFVTGLMVVLAMPLAAQESSAKSFIELYEGQGVDHNLTELPGKIITGNIDWEDTYMTAFSYGRNFGTIGNSPIKQAVQAVYVQHRGLQDNAELGVAYIMHTPDLVIGPIGANFGAGVGLSHAFGTPTYEDGPEDDPENRYNTQLLVLFDVSFNLQKHRNTELFFRVHHRSGAYGLIAPQNVGSNFLAIGLRHEF